MTKAVKWFDELPLWAKIIFALPVLDIVWAVYRIIKGIDTKRVSLVIAGILWIVLGWAILWIIDIVSICIFRELKVFG